MSGHGRTTQSSRSSQSVSWKIFFAISAVSALIVVTSAQSRSRARDLGIAPGVLAPGPLNAITDVDGVRVGHTTIVQGDTVRTRSPSTMVVCPTRTPSTSVIALSGPGR